MSINHVGNINPHNPLYNPVSISFSMFFSVGFSISYLGSIDPEPDMLIWRVRGM